jgi:hypothetical protein
VVANIDKEEAHLGSRATPPGEVDSIKPLNFYAVNDLRNLPAPEWLIEGILGLNTLAVVYGQAGKGKSFVTLDMALSVATGGPWHSQVKSALRGAADTIEVARVNGNRLSRSQCVPQAC